MRRVNLNESIPLHLYYTEDNEPVASATVTVQVYDKSNFSTVVLGSQTCIEQDALGHYLYTWVHSLTVRTQLVAEYDADGRKFSEDIIADKDIVDEIDWQDADGDGMVL